MIALRRQAATTPGYSHDFSHEALNPLDEANDTGILSCLYLSQERTAIADPGIPRNGTNTGKGDEMPDSPFNSPLVEHGIGIEGNDDFAMAHCQC